MLVSRLDNRAMIPTRHHFNDAGYDLYAIESGKILGGGFRELVRTGIAMAIPDGYVGLIHPRSGLANEHGITVLNAPGTIDSGYRGEIKVLLINHRRLPFFYKAGDRIAQIIFQKIESPILLEVDELPQSLREETGFGSSGR